ncbi:MAG: hypothetical protein KJN77_03775 [Gammaproteobacteria bacterium]|nr:hypothetical protein [Gammaproteobacteria bacterium]
MSIEALSGPSERSLLLVHGRDFKPGRDAYLDLSVAALRAGIERDYPECLMGFDAMEKHLAWYADLNAEILEAAGKTYDMELDIGDRRNALAMLRAVQPRKRFGIREYDRLPGKSALPEFIADVSAPLLGSVGLTKALLGTVAKDFAAYFDRRRNYAERVRRRVREELCALLDRGKRVVLLAHGTGSVIAYDVLWQLTHEAELKDTYSGCKIEAWLTLGSPLGDHYLQRRLLGAKEKSESRFPGNVIAWHNVAAEDDYMCHDNTLADDYNKMLKHRVVSAVHDYHVFNMAVRYGKSNPHSSIGYYIHPRVSKLLADWLQSDNLGNPPKYTF